MILKSPAIARAGSSGHPRRGRHPGGGIENVRFQRGEHIASTGNRVPPIRRAAIPKVRTMARDQSHPWTRDSTTAARASTPDRRPARDRRTAPWVVAAAARRRDAPARVESPHCVAPRWLPRNDGHRESAVSSGSLNKVVRRVLATLQKRDRLRAFVYAHRIERVESMEEINRNAGRLE